MGHNGIIAASFINVDTIPPTAPGEPIATSICQTTLTLSWSASTDNVGVTGYKIYDDGVEEVDVGNVLTYDLTGLTAGTTSNWTIKAYDAAGNLSNSSKGTDATQGVSVTSFSCSNNYAVRGTACANETDNTYYHNGEGTFPISGDVIYTNSCGTTKLNGVSGDFYSDGNDSFTVTSGGVTGSYESCT